MISYHLKKQGETLTFLNPEVGSDGRLDIEMQLSAGSVGPKPHIHTRQNEFFKVISGVLIISADGVDHTLRKNDELMIKAGQVHSFRNGSETEPVMVQGYADPALNLYWMLSQMAGIAMARGGSWDDLPLLEASWMLYHLRDEYRLGGIPIPVQNIVLGIFAAIAEITGRSRNIAPKPG
jgi:mannose-6-phosphate isomerase-like protein (cupin superfamily)